MRALKSAAYITLIFLHTITAWADQLIIEPDMGRKPILNFIQNTKHSLNLVIYGITDKSILDALIKLKNNGRTVKVILEDEPYKAKSQNLKAIKSLKAHNIDWQGNIPPYRLIHQKTMISDDENALVMTFNFTRSAFKDQRNFALLLDDKRQVKTINSIFMSDWNHKPASDIKSNFILSPDNSRTRLTRLVESAKHTIDIYAQGLNDYEFIGHLAKAARRGTKIRILTSANTHGKQYSFLRKAGIQFHKTNGLYIHAKVFIIDNSAAIIGSLNLTKSAFDDNRELSVITYNKDIIKNLTGTFEKDWQS